MKNLWAWMDEEDAAFQLEYGDFEEAPDSEIEQGKGCGWAEQVTRLCKGEGVADAAAVMAHICVCPVCEAMYGIYENAKLYPYRLIGGRGGLPLYEMAVPLALGGENRASGILDSLPAAMGKSDCVVHAIPLPKEKGKLLFQYSHAKDTVLILPAPSAAPLEAELYKGAFCLTRQRFQPGLTPSPVLKLHPGADSIAVCYNHEFWLRFALKEI